VIAEVVVSYIVGSVVSIWLFNRIVRERTVAMTLESLVDEGYIRTRIDEDGITQLYKYDELPNIRITFEDVEELMDMDEDELARRIEEVLEEDDDEDDEPPRGTV